MSQPRRILPGATYLITRRTLRRYLLLRPDAATTQLIVYALATSAPRFGIQVHAICAMSSHLHLVVTDVLGQLPKFLQLFHRLVALGTKVLRAWEGSVLDHEPTSVVHLTTRAAIVEKIAYTLANPVAAGLVAHASEWPGAKVLVNDIGVEALSAQRPAIFFDASNPAWPATASLPVTLPPCIEMGDAERFRGEIAAELARQEAQASDDLRRRGLRILGAKRAREISPYARASSYEDVRTLNPTFAVGHRGREHLCRAAEAIRTFRTTYRAALEQWCAGVRSVVFPAGTWWMRVLHGVIVEATLAPLQVA